jgi:hypothetical protein
VNTTYITTTVNEAINKFFKNRETMANNYGLTGGKVGAYNNTSGMGVG